MNCINSYYTYEMYRICFIIIHNLLSVTFVQNLLEIFFKNITLKKDANEKKLHLFKKTQNKKSGFDIISQK